MNGSADSRLRAGGWLPLALALLLVGAGLSAVLLIRGTDGRGLKTEPALKQMREAGHPALAHAAALRCERAKHPCDCAIGVLESLVDADLGEAALELLKQAGEAACPSLARVMGLRAEALARSGELDAASEMADSCLAIERTNPHALYARGLVSWNRGEAAAAKQALMEAIAAGRAAEGQLLLGLVFFREGALAEARVLFREIVGYSPEHVAALYNLALVDQQQNNYRASREGYLKVLQLNPAHLDARFNLALLTHQAGAHDEAKHHLAELRKAAPPGDERVSRLEGALKTAPN